MFVWGQGPHWNCIRVEMERPWPDNHKLLFEGSIEWKFAIEERENLNSKAEVFKDDAAIIAEVCRREAVRNGDTIKVD